MAVVNIASGFGSATNSPVNAYTCPSGRSARVEVTAQFYASEGHVLTGNIAHRRDSTSTTNLPVFGNNAGNISNIVVQSGTGTYYLPSGTSLSIYKGNLYYVAIEEDDG